MTTTTDTSTNRDKLFDIIKSNMVTVEDEVTCHSGETTKTYLDIPAALSTAYAVKIAAKAMEDHIYDTVRGVSRINAIVGPQMGSIPLVMGLTERWANADVRWAIVRDHAKDHGLGGWFVGTTLGPKDTVIITDDVVSTGNSLGEVIEAVMNKGAKVAAVVPLVDRGDRGRGVVEDYGLNYLPLFTYADLGLEPLYTRREQ